MQCHVHYEHNKKNPQKYEPLGDPGDNYETSVSEDRLTQHSCTPRMDVHSHNQPVLGVTARPSRVGGAVTWPPTLPPSHTCYG